MDSRPFKVKDKNNCEAFEGKVARNPSTICEKKHLTVFLWAISLIENS